MNWTDYTAALSQMTGLKDVAGQALLKALLPRIVEFAELKMLRDPDLDFLATRTTDTTQTTTTGSRLVTIPSQFIVIEGVHLFLPANAKPSTPNAQRIVMLRTSRAFIDLTWPVETEVMTPAPWQTYFALFSQQSQGPGIDNQPPSAIRIGPTPDGQYVTEFIGTFRPASLSATNPMTFLSQFLPDLMISASMLFCCGGL